MIPESGVQRDLEESFSIEQSGSFLSYLSLFWDAALKRLPGKGRRKASLLEQDKRTKVQTTNSNPLPRVPGGGGTRSETPPPGGALLRLRPRSLGCLLPGCISARRAMYLRRAVSKTLALPRRAPSGPVPLGKDGECPVHLRGSRLEPAPRTRQHPSSLDQR